MIIETGFSALMQKKRNSIALAMELRFFCVKPSIYLTTIWEQFYSYRPPGLVWTRLFNVFVLSIGHVNFVTGT